MPSLIIHLACAKEYIKKHPRDIKDEKRFFDGCVAPDFTENKDKSHYKITDQFFAVDFKSFLNSTQVDMSDDYWRGYFFHLLCDDYFYRIFYRKESERALRNNDTFYRDYDLLNEKTIKKYQIHYFPEGVSATTDIKGSLKYLQFKKVNKFIRKISKRSLKNYLKAINK